MALLLPLIVGEVQAQKSLPSKHGFEQNGKSANARGSFGQNRKSANAREVQSATTANTPSRRSVLRASTDVQAPTDVAASGITPTSATVSWNGTGDSYNLRYRKMILSEGFESCSQGYLPAGWTALDADGDGRSWFTWDYTDDPNDYYGNPKSFDGKSVNSASWLENHYGEKLVLTPDDWLISPQVPLKGKLSLWAKGIDPDYVAEHFAIYLSTTGKDVADFTTVLIPETVAQGVFTEYTADLSAYAGQVGYIAIRHFNVSDMYRLGVDNITITDESDWVEADGVTSPYTLDGLDDLSSYEVEVQAVTGEQQSSWSTLRFNTSGFTSPTDLAASGITPTTATISWSGDADSYNLRYKKSKVALSEGFESCSEGNLPAGWTTIDADGDGETWFMYDPAYHSDTPYDRYYRLYVLGGVCAISASYYNESALTPDNWLISPRVILNGKLSLWAKGVEPKYAAEHFAIYLSTTGKDVADFTTELVTESEATGVFTEYTADLSAYAGQVGYIAIRHFNVTDMFSLSVDNITITDTSADEGDWVEVNNVTPSYALEGLDDLSSYEVQLQAVYADGVSRWTSGIFVNTLPSKKYDLTLADGSEDHGTAAFTVGGNAATRAKKDDVVTVSVTPNEGYSAKDVTVRAYTSWEAAGARRRAPEIVDAIPVTKNEENGTWSFTMPEANVWVTVTYAKNLQDAWIEAIAEQTYTGEAIEPTIEVKDGETTLTLNTDYTVAYSNNTNAGTATVTITAVAGSDYSGTATKTFTIAKADITMTTAPAAVSGLVYSGEAQTLITAGVASFGTVLYSTDGETYAEALPQGTAAGAYTVYYKVEGDDNHNAFAAQTLNVTIATNKTVLNEAITEAEAYYNTISETNPDAAAALLTAINTAKGVQGNADATQSEIETAAQTLNEAVDAAKADVALKRVTLVIPAKSYMARIDADKRQIEVAVDGVSLYTVKNVTNTEVELTDELSVIEAEMPYFIYNAGDTEVEVSIVVSSEDADDVEYDSEHFKGTLVDKTFTDEDMEEYDHYVLNGGSSFVWVKDAGTLAAGKCWIELSKSESAGARRLTIVHEGEATGISTAKTAADTKDAAVYDLQGRRVMQPTRSAEGRLFPKGLKKGLFIVNGKKVVIK